MSQKYNLDGITFPPRPVKQILDVAAKTEIHNFKTTEPSRRGVSLADAQLVEEARVKPIFCICLQLLDWPLSTPFIECIFCQKFIDPNIYQIAESDLMGLENF